MNNKFFICAILITSFYNAYCMQNDPNSSAEDEEYQSMLFATLDAIQASKSNVLQDVQQAISNSKVTHPANQEHQKEFLAIIADQKKKEEEEAAEKEKNARIKAALIKKLGINI